MTEIVMMVQAFRKGDTPKAESYMRLFIENNPFDNNKPIHKRTDAEFLSRHFQMILDEIDDNTTCLDHN